VSQSWPGHADQRRLRLQRDAEARLDAGRDESRGLVVDHGGGAGPFLSGDELEEAQEIARLLEGARDAPGCRIFIGSENRMFALSGSSVIAAPYRGSQGEVVGVVGVIGPTRLNYARVVPMVDFTAKALTRLMA